MQPDGQGKLIFLRILAVSSFSFLSAAAIYFRHRKRFMRNKKPVPLLLPTVSGRIDKLESFSDYVARQLGFEDSSKCPLLCKLADDYLRKAKGCEDNVYAFFANDPNSESLYVKLIEEFDKCLLGYFAFHWSHASLMITQVLSDDVQTPKSKFRNIVMSATREKRFERVTKSLKVTRVFSTLVEEMKAIGIPSNGDSQSKEVMVPMALSERSPVLLLMGGGMGAGKSTVLKDVLKESFWSEAGANAVVVEADAFKETDVIYRALSSSSSHHHDMLQTAELVHQSSTDAASSLLVTALNEGRDVIMDGTLSWEPFVQQTIAMARNVHRRRYRMGAGYKVLNDGSIIENYWEQIEEGDAEATRGEVAKKRKPYRIELVGVVCDAYLAVVRGIRRAILVGRAVRVKPQLQSHKRFASLFPSYCKLVDNARLYRTNAMQGPPKLIAWKDGDKPLLVDPDEIDCLRRVRMLNEKADSIYELYPHDNHVCRSHTIWNDLILVPSRACIQQELKMVIKQIENQTL